MGFNFTPYRNYISEIKNFNKFLHNLEVFTNARNKTAVPDGPAPHRRGLRGPAAHVTWRGLEVCAPVRSLDPLGRTLLAGRNGRIRTHRSHRSLSKPYHCHPQPAQFPGLQGDAAPAVCDRLPEAGGKHRPRQRRSQFSGRAVEKRLRRLRHESVPAEPAERNAGPGNRRTAPPLQERLPDKNVRRFVYCEGE